MRSATFKVQALVFLLTFGTCLFVTQAQSPVKSKSGATAKPQAPAPTKTLTPAPPPVTSTEWETLRPDGEEFSVLMPKGSTFETSKEPYHKMELNTRTYLSKGVSGPVFAVVSLSGIKSNPALYTEMQRMNSYVDAFRTLFSPKVRKDAVARLELVGNKSLQGNAGREYRMTLGDLSGTAQVFATRKRFYSIVYLDTKKDAVLQDQFLSSFVLPEKTNETTAQAPAVEEAPPAPAEAEAQKNKTEPTPKTEDVPHGSQAGKRGPVSAGVLNGKAISLPVPDYPAEAKAAGAEGVVVIQVLVDEQGNVTDARPISGPKLLQETSLIAARQAKFSPTLLSGEAVKVTGVLVFNFGHPLG
jgi:TonB family protein